jgi:hypothetical protein
VRFKATICKDGRIVTEVIAPDGQTLCSEVYKVTPPGIDAFLEDERGKQLGEVLDPETLLSRAIQHGGLDSTVCLRFLDPWGNATFNSLQVQSSWRSCEPS